MSNQNRNDIWNKLKSSTKSFSSSLTQLSTRNDRDGDTPTSTLVHKALLKHYKKREPFVGFPEWLGHTEDIGEEHNAPSIGSSADHSVASMDSGPRRTAGLAFQKIYSSVSVSRPAGEAGSAGTTMQGRLSKSSDHLVGPRTQGATWGSQRQQLLDQDRSQTSEQPAEPQPRSLHMRERMKRNLTKRGTFDL
ncbi:ABR115Cp [Eremothecium gossypii ATCC 10895]|uniref:ABR115Cp n=1 Tax=Eremothecium gossypii (strain ATCC 10895 / CBS 109.51 / FGSC 9923 / NRRL Y-1056) TaxID=284811 RepID=Q75DA9_EREGS|nr:ABR115Cp [Eremothecium gossypii ATCC 10895]AAS50886.2 ABR115Cp [Eremothecium gossypii ATCC 10895]AEY95175.1 FABR115Cp [Eremothecium gossypii FDAG1]